MPNNNRKKSTDLEIENALLDLLNDALKITPEHMEKVITFGLPYEFDQSDYVWVRQKGFAIHISRAPGSIQNREYFRAVVDRVEEGQYWEDFQKRFLLNFFTLNNLFEELYLWLLFNQVDTDLAGEDTNTPPDLFEILVSLRHQMVALQHTGVVLARISPTTAGNPVRDAGSPAISSGTTCHHFPRQPMSNWTHLPPNFDPKNYSWTWYDKEKTEQRLAYLDKKYQANNAISLQRAEAAAERKRTGYWKVWFWGEFIGYLRDRPTPQLRNTARKLFLRMMDGFRTIPLKPVQNTYEDLYLELSAGVAALIHLEGILQSEPTTWEDNYKRAIQERITHQDVQDMAVAKAAFHRLQSYMQRIIPECADGTYWHMDVSQWRQKDLIDEWALDQE